MEFIKKALEVGTPENLELYWFLVEIFTDADCNKDGLICKRLFPTMMNQLMSNPVKFGLTHPDKVISQ